MAPHRNLHLALRSRRPTDRAPPYSRRHVFGRIFLPWSLTSLTNSEQRDHHRQPRTQERDGAARIPVRSRAGVTIANCSALASADCSAHDGAVVPLIAGAVLLLEQSSHHDRRRPAAARCCSRTTAATCLSLAPPSCPCGCGRAARRYQGGYDGMQNRSAAYICRAARPLRRRRLDCRAWKLPARRVQCRHCDGAPYPGGQVKSSRPGSGTRRPSRGARTASLMTPSS
jgi:hypothetical protein